MSKVYARFEAKKVQKPYPLERHKMVYIGVFTRCVLLFYSRSLLFTFALVLLLNTTLQEFPEGNSYMNLIKTLFAEFAQGVNAQSLSQ